MWSDRSGHLVPTARGYCRVFVFATPQSNLLAESGLGKNRRNRLIRVALEKVTSLFGWDSA